MKCQNCGFENEDNAVFCRNCGTKLIKEAEVLDMPDPGISPAPAPSSFRPQHYKTIIFCVIGCVIAASIGYYFFKQNSSSQIDDYFNYAYKISDDENYFVYADGTSKKIEGSVKWACITTDHKHAVIQYNDNTLSISSATLSNAQQITDNCKTLMTAGNDFVTYYDSDKNVWRYSINNKESTNLGKITYYVFSKDKSSLLFTINNEIYIIKSADKEATLIGNYNGDIVLSGIYDNGNVSFFETYVDQTYESFIYDNGTINSLGKVTHGTPAKSSDSNGSFAGLLHVTYTKDQKILTVEDNYLDKCWVKQSNESIAELPNVKEYYSVYSNENFLSRTTSKQAKSIYFDVASTSDGAEKSTGTGLYYLNSSGSMDLVLTDISQCYIINNRIIYIDSSRTLHSADINGNQIRNDKVIDYDITFLTVRGTEYLYYTKGDITAIDYKEIISTYALYCYKLGDQQPIMVVDNLSVTLWSPLNSSSFLSSDDGKTIAFFTDIMFDREQNIKYGNLYTWSYGKGSAEFISDNVICAFYYNPPHTLDCFPYYKYTTHDSEDNYCDMLLYKNGTTTTIINNLNTKEIH
jgi:hypothetical protein